MKKFLSHFVAQTGLCSRRKAAMLIKSGQISVNGVATDDPARHVANSDCVKFGGRILRQETAVALVLNKPRGYVSTTSDEKGRATIVDLIPASRTRRLFSIGRLDQDTTGLIVLTNDGALAQRLAHPRYCVKKVYHATLDAALTDEQLHMIRRGIRLRDGIAKVDHVGFVNRKNKKVVQIALHSGKKRIIRRIAEFFGNKVCKLDRVNYAGLTKKGLRSGMWRYLSSAEVARLKA